MENQHSQQKISIVARRDQGRNRYVEWIALHYPMLFQTLNLKRHIRRFDAYQPSHQKC